ncbi:MAG: NAD-dependent epimerase/dehydratase family protein [Endomicrobiia bacterium]|nr:NAD-dependent epimerase/dehydratase family protein [Endomicrobiia bacterium]
MKIIVTGGAGFIGSHVADAYVAAGHEVVVADNLSSGKKENLKASVPFRLVDITDRAKLRKVFLEEMPDVVSHHAAQIDVRKSVEDPAYDARVNIVGIINVLESARESGAKKVAFASSGGTIYGECQDIPPAEDAPVRPLSPYGISKLSSEFYLKYYAAQFGLKFTALRYGNVYGPRQDPHGEAGVVAIFALRLLKNEECFIYGDGRQSRDYVFVGDIAAANLLALSSGDNEIINIGTAVATDVNTLFASLAAAVSGYSKPPVFKSPRKGELFKSFLDTSKAASVLGWRPSVSLDEGLKKTMDFFKDKK